MSLQGPERLFLFDEYYEKIVFILFTNSKDDTLPHLKLLANEHKNKRQFCTTILEIISRDKFSQYRFDYAQQWEVIYDYCTEGSKSTNWFKQDRGKNTMWLIATIVSIFALVQKLFTESSKISLYDLLLIVGVVLAALLPLWNESNSD